MKALVRFFLTLAICLVPFQLVSARHVDTIDPVQAIVEDGVTVCTAFAVSPHQWLTAQHCMADDDGEWHEYTIAGSEIAVTRTYDMYDISVISLPDQVSKGLVLSKHTPRVGDRVIMRGFPLGYGRMFTFEGHIAVIDLSLTSGENNQPYIKTVLDMTSCRGDSGSPVTNTRGELVSMMHVGFGIPTGCSAMSAGATWDQLGEVLADLQS